MESGSAKADVNDMFQKMGEKLGWFKHKDLDAAAKVLSKSAKKKSTKSRVVKRREDIDKNIQKPTQKILRDIKKLKKKQGDSSERHKVDIPPKRVPAHTSLPKALSFNGLLSSDSDSSFSSKPEQGQKGGNAKATLQVCSDSDEDPVILEDTYIGCIPESPTDDLEKSDERRNKMSTVKKGDTGVDDDYDELILKNRVSLASFSPDLESFGEPLVESTRIHRRSSVTYKQFMTSPDASIDSSNELGKFDQDFKQIKENCERNKVEIDAKLCSGFKYLDLRRTGESDDENNAEDGKITMPNKSPCNTTNVLYITAVEKLEDLDRTEVDVQTGDVNDLQNGRDRHHIKNTESKNVFRRDTVDTEEHVYDYGNISESDEVVEVVDIATQTENESPERSSSIPNTPEVRSNLRVYREETIMMTETRDDTALTVNKSEISFYDQITVDRIDLTEDISDSTNDVSELFNNEEHARTSSPSPKKGINYHQESALKDGDCVSNISTESSDSRSLCMYDQPTVSVNSSGQFSDLTVDKQDCAHVFDQATVIISKPVHSTVSDNSLDTEDLNTDQIENVTLDESEIEVIDIGTQTEKLSADTSNLDNEAFPEAGQKTVAEHVTETEKKIDKIKESVNPDFDEDEVSDEDSEVEEPYRSKLEDSADIIQEKLNSQGNHHVTEQHDSSVEQKNEDKPSSRKKAQSFIPSSSSDDDGSPLKFPVKSRKTDKNRPVKTTSVKESGNVAQKKKIDLAEQSWRSSTCYSSDSSDGDLEAFFQKLKKPEKPRQKPKSVSEGSSSESMKDFIVEDDEMTSGSDDSAFYIRETQKLEETPVMDRLTKNKGLLFPAVRERSDDDDVFSSKLYPESVTKHKKNCHPKSWSFSTDSETDNDSSDQEEREETGQNGRRKIPNRKSQKNEKQKKEIQSICVSSDSENDVESPMFKTPNPIRKIKRNDTSKENQFKTPKSKVLGGYISSSKNEEDDSDDDGSLPDISQPLSNKESVYNSDLKNSKINPTTNPDLKLPTPASKGRQQKLTTPLATKGGSTYSFLNSLSTAVDYSRRHPQAVGFMKGFKKNKEELSQHLFTLYNRTIFDGKLPSDLPILWNKRLLRTAGFCSFKTNRNNKEDRTARVELSTKVCDSPERTRDTLIHELCHAAVWLLNGVNGGHGPYWKYWARHSNQIHPELPVIKRCHSYSINTKFTYRCIQCSYSIGRHSKSLDTINKVCGHCRGTFELIQNSVPTTPGSSGGATVATPKAPNPFAMFVKDHYSTVKKKNTELKHGGVMKELSKLFAESKIST